jgi:hypothetical protein
MAMEASTPEPLRYAATVWTRIAQGGDLTCEWDGSESTDWSVAGNWGSNAVPSANATVNIPRAHRTNRTSLPTGAGNPNAGGRPDHR